MIILAIETSSERGSMALSRDGKVASTQLDAGPKQSETAMRRLRDLLAGCGMRIEDVDAVAFGSGPGMFTGLRLGCGLAQGLAIGLSKPIVAVSSLHALAARCQGARIVAATDARMGEIYLQCFERDDTGLHPRGAAECVPPEELRPLAPAGGWQGIGSAFEVYAGRLPEAFLQSIEMVDGEARARAEEVAAIAAERLAEGRATPLEAAVPQYVRNKVALTTRERLARGGDS
ncbi:MAG: tRNA (adenosine(37)-N6)-threonylcarbamoyltransferase complex dimerization subunit type 1 TsaB [Rhodocyclaceae bacterium]|nr:tRNA (adenosine(37)-N6)-threonylcarbamoyltransferase complex dimerization subunit type 1 TsaB [Rhodocyclaceae bacterium]